MYLIYKKSPLRRAYFYYGWDIWIRTREMADSESAALPLGDIPICFLNIA